jgi:WhiB family transcriptional regulator, redox-sensing transcriptional regulator
MGAFGPKFLARNSDREATVIWWEGVNLRKEGSIMPNQRRIGRGGRLVLSESSWTWQQDAACRCGPVEVFFGPEGEKPAERQERELRAVEICAGCPVRQECQRHAVRLPEAYGVWGGTTEAGRQAFRRGRLSSPAA